MNAFMADLNAAARRIAAGESVGASYLYGRNAVALARNGLCTPDSMRAYRSAWYFQLKALYGLSVAQAMEAEAIYRHQTAEDLWPNADGRAIDGPLPVRVRPVVDPAASYQPPEQTADGPMKHWTEKNEVPDADLDGLREARLANPMMAEAVRKSEAARREAELLAQEAAGRFGDNGAAGYERWINGED